MLTCDSFFKIPMGYYCEVITHESHATSPITCARSKMHVTSPNKRNFARRLYECFLKSYNGIYSSAGKGFIKVIDQMPALLFITDTTDIVGNDLKVYLTSSCTQACPFRSRSWIRFHVATSQ